MEEQGAVLKDFYGQTTLHPVGLIAVILLGLAMLMAPRKYAVWPMIFMACFIAPAQRLVIITLNFNLLRVMIFFAVARILSRKEYVGIRLCKLDWLLLAYSISTTTINTLQLGTLQSFTTVMGLNFELFGMYLTFRCLIRSWEDLHGLTLGFIVASIPTAAAFMVENLTGRNLFAFLGGVNEITVVREGRLRCQGAFSHTILAGCFWAAVLPLIAARWFDLRKSKLLTVMGIACCLIIIITTASSTPLMAVVFALLAASLFPLRKHMRIMRWSLLFILIGLHMVMQKPVWHLIARMGVIGGSAYHRYRLIDGAINHFSEWWLLGTTDTESWGWGLHDVTNQFILEGVYGGFLSMVLFVSLLAVAFGNVGRLWRMAQAKGNRTETILAWSLGVMLFVHVTSFIAVSYFGQISMLIWLSLAISASLLQQQGSPAPLPVRQPGFYKPVPYATR